MKILSKTFQVIQRDGFRWFLVRIFGLVLNQKMEIERTKEKALNLLRKKYNSKVAYGLFKGMKLNQDSSWDPYGQITQILGTYEEHVAQELKKFSSYGSVRFVDIGAADGYFAIGMVKSDLYKEAFTFEISNEGQNIIKKNAFLNDCSELIQVFGEANTKSISKTLSDGKLTSFLIDIEGMEYDFLNEEMLELLKNSFVICELHPWLVDEGNDLEKSLITRASKYFDCKLMRRENYNPNSFQEFDDFTDEQRLIIVGEGRHKNMNWMILTPKQS